jgi:hypothetical protein
MTMYRFFYCICLLLLFPVLLLATDTITMKDGSKHTGTFLSATARVIAFKEGRTVHHYPRSSVASMEFGTGASGSEGAASAQGAAERPGSRRSVTLPAGTEIAVLTNDAIDSATATEGKTFSADVAENVTNSAGQIVIPKGSPAELVLRKVTSGGVTGSSELTLDLQSVKVGGRRYTVNTADLEQKGSQGLGANKRTAEMVGGGAALGTLIGAIAGHGKGAAIGAAAGAAAGAGTQILTRGKSVKVPAEAILRFKLDQPLRLDAAY